jgi:hypothetical protein
MDHSELNPTETTSGTVDTGSKSEKMALSSAEADKHSTGVQELSEKQNVQLEVRIGVPF